MESEQKNVHDRPRTFIIDCAGLSDEPAFWRLYLQIVRPDGSANFGRNMDAFRDAVLAGGPGWPGECILKFVNTDALERLAHGVLYRGLQRLANESRDVRILMG